MRDKNLLQLFLVLNSALAGCFVIYLFVSSTNHPKVTKSSVAPAAAEKTNTGANAAKASGALPETNSARLRSNAVTTAETNASPGTNALPAAAEARAVFSQKKFNWEQMESDEQKSASEYKVYLDSLRAVGCPEEKIQYIVLADINELFAKRRLKEAITHDLQWWRTEPEISVAGVLQAKGRTLEEERRGLIEKYLGPDVLEREKGEATLWSTVQLTGPVLGALSPDVHSAVQDICARSIERSQGAFWGRVNDGQPLNQVEMARLRETTRSDLRKVLGQDAMEEFLLRYSHNAHQLRAELRGFEPTPEEFRKILRATDTMDHQLQLEYGGPTALSQQQRDRYQSQRDAAIKEAVGAERYQDYLLVKDPLYRQAQATAMQYGAPTKAIMPIYQMTKANETKRQEILNNSSLSPQEKSAALTVVNQEQTRSVQQIISEIKSR